MFYRKLALVKQLSEQNTIESNLLRILNRIILIYVQSYKFRL